MQCQDDELRRRVVAHPSMKDEYRHWGGEEMTVAERQTVFEEVVRRTVDIVVGGRAPSPEDYDYTEDTAHFFQEEVGHIVALVQRLHGESSRPAGDVRTLGSHAAHPVHAALAARLFNAADVRWTFAEIDDTIGFMVVMRATAAANNFVYEMASARHLASGVAATRLPDRAARAFLALSRADALDRLATAVAESGLALAQDEFVTISVETEIDGAQTIWATFKGCDERAAAEIDQELRFADRVGASWIDIAAEPSPIGRYVAGATAYREGVLAMLTKTFDAGDIPGVVIHMTTDEISVLPSNEVRVRRGVALHDSSTAAVFGAAACSLVIVPPLLQPYSSAVPYVSYIPGSLMEIMPAYAARCGERESARQVFSGDTLTPANESGIPMAWVSTLVPRVAVFAPKEDAVDVGDLL